jgi:uncharacterized metal-binding protein
VSGRATTVSGLVVGLLVLLVAWIFELPVAHVAVLAPVVVVVAAAVAGLGVFWARAARESYREAKRPRLIAGAAIAIVGLGIALTILGVELPRE